MAQLGVVIFISMSGINIPKAMYGFHWVNRLLNTPPKIIPHKSPWSRETSYRTKYFQHHTYNSPHISYVANWLVDAVFHGDFNSG